MGRCLQLPNEVCWPSEWRAHHWSLGTLDACCYPPLSRALGISVSRAREVLPRTFFFWIMLEVGRRCCDYLRFHVLFHIMIIIRFSYFVPWQNVLGTFFFAILRGFPTCSVAWESGCQKWSAMLGLLGEKFWRGVSTKNCVRFEGQDDSTIVAFKQGSHYQATMSHDTVPDKKSGCWQAGLR